MKSKIFFIGILSLFTFMTYGQTDNNEVIESKSEITEFKITIEHFDELENFDWNVVKKMFEKNDKNQEIKLELAYVNKSEIDTSKIRVDNFEVKLTGKSGDTEKLVAKLKKSFEKLVEIYTQD